MPEAMSNDADDPIADLRMQWVQLVGDDAPLTALIRRHRERHRRYHTLDHVVAVVRHVNDLAADETVTDMGVVVAAAWFHDAVYEPQSPANERASARLARSDLAKLGWSTERADDVGTMVEGTAHHTDPVDMDTTILYDADLAVLGTTPSEYETYVSNVRAEYAHVDDQDWTAGRSDVLDGFLSRSRIYATTAGFDRWEAAARENLTAELEALRR